MALTAHLQYPGQCEEAFKLYARIFSGQLMMLAYRDTPTAAEMPADWQDKIVHATLSFNRCTLAGSDVLPAQYRRPQGFSVLVNVDGADNANRIFNALADGGRVELAIEKTFWSPAFGVLVDRFDIPWEINGQAPDSAK